MEILVEFLEMIFGMIVGVLLGVGLTKLISRIKPKKETIEPLQTTDFLSTWSEIITENDLEKYTDTKK